MNSSFMLHFLECTILVLAVLVAAGLALVPRRRLAQRAHAAQNVGPKWFWSTLECLVFPLLALASIIVPCFAEAAQARALPLLFLQPFGEDEFIARSVRPVSEGEQWVARYRKVAARLASPPRAMPPAAAVAEAAYNPFERCNRWLLDTALACGGDRVWLLCLWDGRRGDGAGGTAHMVEEVSRHRGHVLHIDPRDLQAHDPAGRRPDAGLA